MVAEYSGVLSTSPLDKTASAANSGSNTAASTGTTATTTQANELWIGAIGLRDSTYTLGTPTNSFTAVTSAKSTGSTTGSNAKVYFLEKSVSATGTAWSGGTVSTSSRWSGAIATFKATGSSTLALSGPAAGNYTLTGATGAVTITPKALTVSGLAAANRNYDGTPVAALTGTAALLEPRHPAPAPPATASPTPATRVTLGGTAAGAFADKHAGTLKPVTVSGNTLGGAQAGNYTLTQQAGLTANISALPITVAAVTATKTYDGTTTAPGTPDDHPAAGERRHHDGPEPGVSNKGRRRRPTR